jgi:hypothetical protein
MYKGFQLRHLVLKEGRGTSTRMGTILYTGRLAEC